MATDSGVPQDRAVVSEPGVAPLTLDRVFSLLSNQRRRRVLDVLAATGDGRATLRELAEHVAGLENDVEPAHLSSQQRKRAYVSLHQTHLPTLDQHGVIDFDGARGVVTLRDSSRLEPYLALAAETGDRDADWGPTPGRQRSGEAAAHLPALRHRGFRGLAAVLTAVALVGLAGVGPLAAVARWVWVALAVAAVFGLAMS